MYGINSITGRRTDGFRLHEPSDSGNHVKNVVQAHSCVPHAKTDVPLNLPFVSHVEILVHMCSATRNSQTQVPFYLQVDIQDGFTGDFLATTPL